MEQNQVSSTEIIEKGRLKIPPISMIPLLPRDNALSSETPTPSTGKDGKRTGQGTVSIKCSSSKSRTRAFNVQLRSKVAVIPFVKRQQPDHLSDEVLRGFIARCAAVMGANNQSGFDLVAPTVMGEAPRGSLCGRLRTMTVTPQRFRPSFLIRWILSGWASSQR
ncbi:hypothetical protein D9757_012114 [Collybiopsis confluens]|uniref:Uncharacterized protein n=1 Tax=Collybiopsis confluens TaxID=2823264 RepID=A0A8H5GIH0_9AGAR|nr:hypothetical protein D9757_012114 [Collybiopsis confluens]